MADLIQIKGGSGDVPTLQDRELAIKKNGNESELYCGLNGIIVRLCGAGDKELLETLSTTLSGLQETLTTINAEVESINTDIDAINATIENIIARLGKLETPSE